MQVGRQVFGTGSKEFLGVSRGRLAVDSQRTSLLLCVFWPSLLNHSQSEVLSRSSGGGGAQWWRRMSTTIISTRAINIVFIAFSFRLLGPSQLPGASRLDNFAPVPGFPEIRLTPPRPLHNLVSDALVRALRGVS